MWGIIIMALVILTLLIVGKGLANVAPIAFGFVVLLFVALFVKTCNDMEREEQERKNWTENRMKNLEKEMKETEYMRTEEYQKKEYRRKYWHEEE